MNGKAVSAMAFLLLAAIQPVWSADGKGTIVFRNSTDSVRALLVEIRHTDGRVQKSKKVAAGDSGSFTFSTGSACEGKSRRYRVWAVEDYSDNTMVFAGAFRFKADTERLGWNGNCRLYLDSQETTEQIGDVTVEVGKVAADTGVYTITVPESALP